MRNYNPIDLRPLPADALWQGQDGVDRAGICRFRGWPWGLRAAALQLRGWGRRHGPTTLEGVAARWASAATVAAARHGLDQPAQRLARMTGWPAEEGLDLEAPSTLRPLIEAMGRIALGLDDSDPLPWSAADMDQALELAGFALDDQGAVRTTPPPAPSTLVDRLAWIATAAGAALMAAAEALEGVAVAGGPAGLGAVAAGLVVLGLALTAIGRLRSAAGR